ncbi:ABC transporter permease [Streptomyces spororaveus]|uniref:ABC transporter n=1 Tax=Streptomyces spororaveus TaxID=284039 RepID=A0ABQ3TGW1_9ACTN|nr:FtsX-like permease family protein [Streptomyces spororaveus]GHI79621.1 ABC transporter [Streptomyces spororaveus]
MLKTALRNVLAHKARLLMTVLAVTLGVAFVSGTLVFADSSTAAHRAALSKDYADIAVTVTPKDPPPGAASAAGPAGSAGDAGSAGSAGDEHATVLDDVLARKLAALPGVAAVRPSADGLATLNAADGSPLRTGRTWAHRAAAYVPGADGKDGRHPLTEGRAPRGGDEIAVDSGTAAAGRFRIGAEITLATDGPAMKKRLVGIVTTRDTRVTAGGTLALFDMATAQQLFASPGRYTSIDLSAAPGSGEAELSRRVAALLPADRAEATTGTAQAAQQAVLVDTLTRGNEKLSLVFAGVALFIGSFLIVNTFTMLVARRTREIALLRAIGATRRQVVRSLLWEAVLLGLAASALGFVLGLGIASVLPRILGTAGESLPRGPLVIGPLPVMAALAVGVGITVLAAWLPSRKAARIAPVEAMRVAEQPPTAAASRARGAAGALLLALGAGLLLSLAGAKDASEENLRSAMSGCALLVVAVIVLAPLLAVPVIRLGGRLTGRLGIAGHLAHRNALRDPRRTAATASALMVSTALVAGLSVIGHSTGQALDRRAAAGLGADYVISTHTASAGIDPAAVQRVTAAPGVRTATAVADSTLFIGGGVREISGVDPAAAPSVMKLDFVSGSLKDLGPGRIALSRTLARENGVSTGGRIDARIGGPGQDLAPYTVVGVYEDNPTAREALGARTEVQRNSLTPGSVQRVLVRTGGGAHDGATEDRLRTATGENPLLKIQSRKELVREAAGSLSTLLTLTYGLLVIGGVIAALGIMNTLAMSVSDRTREIGVLRAIGMDRAGIRRMIRLESLTVAAFGTLLGLTTGLFGAWTVGALTNGALKGYALALPWDTLLLVCVISLATGVVAAALPARHASALGPLEAVAEI